MKKSMRIVTCSLSSVIVCLYLWNSCAFAQGGLLEWLQKRSQRRQPQAESYGASDPTFYIQHDGLTRKYKVHLPRWYNRKRKLPVVIYIHGGAGDMTAAYRDGIDKFSDKYGFVLAVPLGTGKVRLGHFWGSWNGGNWETGECCGDADDVGFISKMIEQLKARFNVDENRIYATGISNGGLMTNRLACELSDKIAAIATVAPAALMSGCNPARPVPVMDIHGTADPANPPDGSESKSIFNEESGSVFAKSYKRMTPYQVVDAWKKINKCSDKKIAGYENGGAKCVIYNDCTGEVEVELCMVEGMGHTYPSGSQYFPAKTVGPVSYDISFEQIWEFFKRHSRK